MIACNVFMETQNVKRKVCNKDNLVPDAEFP